MKFAALLAVACLLGIARLNAQDASLRLESVPDGADIMLNGKFCGITPATISLEAGSFRVVIQKTGFQPWMREVQILAGSSPTLRADLNPADPTKLQLPTLTDNLKPSPVGSGVSAPQLLSKVDPTYSAVAREALYGGMVVIQLVVDTNGAPRDLRVIRGLGLGLDERALDAVKQWTFQPGMKEGKPVNVRATVQVNFRLIDDDRRLPNWRLRRVSFQAPQNGTAAALVQYKRPETRPYARPGYAKAQLEFEVDEEGRV